jgi:hypothetical protein
VLEDFLSIRELVIVAEGDLVDFLAGGDLGDVPAEDVLELESWLDVVLGGDQAGVLPVFTSKSA